MSVCAAGERINFEFQYLSETANTQHFWPQSTSLSSDKTHSSQPKTRKNRAHLGTHRNPHDTFATHPEHPESLAHVGSKIICALALKFSLQSKDMRPKPKRNEEIIVKITSNFKHMKV